MALGASDQMLLAASQQAAANAAGSPHRHGAGLMMAAMMASAAGSGGPSSFGGPSSYHSYGFGGDASSSTSTSSSVEDQATALTLQGAERSATRGYAAMVVAQVLEKLLQVAITDTEAVIRRTVIASLDPSFDPFLSQSENLRMLFMALNDEVFEIRTLCIPLLGRLMDRNPAYVLPAIRKRLIQLLSELEFTTDVDSIGREHAARQLALLIEAGHKFIVPYARPALDGLLRRVLDPDPRVASHIMDAIGQLARVADVSYMFDRLLPIILETLQDNSSQMKRRAALRTLGHLVQSTGFVITPILKYSRLLDSLSSILKTEQSPDMKHLVIRALGILGALDPETQRFVSTSFMLGTVPTVKCRSACRHFHFE
jgi:phosphatidylinositol kinase/protein kinase (PI-3  family)